MMNDLWKWHRLKLHVTTISALFCVLHCQLSFCWSLNIEGLVLLKFKEKVNSDPFNDLFSWRYVDGDFDCCSWFGIELFDGRLTSSNTAEHEGMIHRKLLQGIDILSRTKVRRNGNNMRSQESPLQLPLPSPSPSPSPGPGHTAISLSPSGQSFPSISVPPSTSISSPAQVPTPSDPELLTPVGAPLLPPNPAPSHVGKTPTVIIQDESSPTSIPSSSAPNELLKHAKSKNHVIFILSGVFGGLLIASVLVFALAYCRRNKVVTVKPWATGLSGQLQKAFVTGVPKLQRLELETACEDFSNIIDSFPNVTIYKGTLSSGVEIAVESTAAKSAKEWSKNLEAQFRNKVETLSKVNHKNFVNLIGYCEEQQPFTRMMVFEYAPNGTLFDHLHIKGSEHLDWGTRLRIAMGVAYCLQYMHQLTPPIAHRNLRSSSIYFTEDYAAKISDFNLGNEVIAANTGSATKNLLEIQTVDPEANIYNFAVILLEMITGRLPHTASSGSLADWALDQFKKGRPLQELVDPTLDTFREEEVVKLFGLIKDCLLPNPKLRPTMTEITAKMKEITTLGPDGATPKSSPLWWAELELLSSV